MFKGFFDNIFGLDNLYLKDDFTGHMTGPYRGSLGEAPGGNLHHNVYMPGPFDDTSFEGPFEGTINSESSPITGFIVLILCWVFITIWLPIQALRWTSHFLFARRHKLAARAIQYGVLSVIAWTLCFANFYLIGEASGINRTYIHIPLLLNRTKSMQAQLPSQITLQAKVPSCNPADVVCFDGNLRVVIKNNSRRTLNIIGSWNFIPIGKIWEVPDYDNQCLFLFEENWSPNIVKPGGTLNLGCQLNEKTLTQLRTNGFNVPVFGTVVLTDTSTNVDIGLKLPIVFVK